MTGILGKRLRLQEKKRALLAVGLAFSVSANASGPLGDPADTTAETTLPNILVIFSDDHALRVLSAYGDSFVETPNIDRIAKKGMLFRHSKVTNSICGPSRAVLLTGKHSHLNGFLRNSDVFDGSQPTLPKLLRKNGYESAVIGKWHLKSEPVGFDHWEVLIDQGFYYNTEFKSADGIKRVNGYVTDLVADKSIEWLENRKDKSRPFFLMSQHKAPHREWQPAMRHLDLFSDTVFPEPDTLFDDYSNRASPASNSRTIRTHYLHRDLKYFPKGSEPTPEQLKDFRVDRMDPEDFKKWRKSFEKRNAPLDAGGLEGDELVSFMYQRYMQDYLRTIVAMDEAIGRTLDYLEESGLADNTIVIYTSDQGFYLGEHGWYDKRWIYEESLHTPLLISGPGLATAMENDMLIQNLDLAPTILSLAGVDVPTDMQGRNLVPVLKGETPTQWRDAVYYHYYEHGGHGVPRHFGARTDRYKIAFYYSLNEWELFDLEKDPQELHSVYGSPEYAVVERQMKSRLKALQKQYKDYSATTFWRHHD